MSSNEQGSIFDDLIPPSKQETKKEDPTNPMGNMPKGDFPYADEVKTSYLLVNALMTVLVKKGLINEEEVNDVLTEMYIEYKRKKGQL